MARAELGQQLTAGMDRVVSFITHAPRGRYFVSGGEKVAVVHYRKGGEEAGVKVRGMEVVGHSRDIVHVFEAGKLADRFKLGEPAQGTERMTGERVYRAFHRIGGMEN